MNNRQYRVYRFNLDIATLEQELNRIFGEGYRLAFIAGGHYIFERSRSTTFTQQIDTVESGQVTGASIGRIG